MKHVETHHYTSKNLDDHVGYIAGQLDKSVRDGETRKLATQIVNGSGDYIKDPRTGKSIAVVRAWNHNFRLPPGEPCKMRDYECEVGRIWDFIVLNVRYTEDPVDIDTFATLKETLIMGAGDCFLEGTQVLKFGWDQVNIESLEPGMSIWGKEKWSLVRAVAPRGVRPLTRIMLNNRSTICLTENHKVEVLTCSLHKPESCNCPIRYGRRISVADLKEGMVLPQPPKHLIRAAQIGRIRPKFLQVTKIEREVFEAPTWDIQTDDHYVYLPEADATVRQCDDMVISMGALLKSLGYPMAARVISTKDAPRDYCHIYPLAGIPKERPRIWVPLDATVEGAYPGWQFERIAKSRDYQL